MEARVLLFALLAIIPACASFFVQSSCGCSTGCPQQPPCPVQPPPPVCPQYQPCPAYAAASAAPFYAAAAPQQQQQSYSVVDQFVQPLQQLQQPQPQYVQQQAAYAQQQPQYVRDLIRGAQHQQPTVIYLDQYAGTKAGQSVKVGPQVTYQSLPSGGSRLIVPPGSDVYALNAGAGAPYQYEQPMVVYRTAQLPAAGGYAAVEQNVDEMDLKGMQYGIPLKTTEQKRETIEAIEKLADAADEEEEEKLIRKVRSLVNDDVISREDKEEEMRDYGELISSDEEIEMIGGGKREKKKEKKKEMEEADEEQVQDEQELEEAAPKKTKKHTEKTEKSRRSSKRARAESDAAEVNVERDNDELDRKKCNSRRLYEIMLENMNESSASSKRSINNVAEAEFGTSIDVICSRGHFSYVFSSNLYCEASKGHVTCIAFRQAPPTATEE